eukprot:6442736-Lingulodinium_polyedra.AAC.1
MRVSFSARVGSRWQPAPPPASECVFLGGGPFFTDGSVTRRDPDRFPLAGHLVRLRAGGWRRPA